LKHASSHSPPITIANVTPALDCTEYRLQAARLTASSRPQWAVRGVAHGVERHVPGLAGAQYFGRGTEGGIARAGREAVYWYVSIPARQIGDSRDAERIAQRTVAQFDQRFRAIVSATNPRDMRLDELLDREPLPRWGRGPVTLPGDAAHPMLPHAGQGAAQALEDAVALGRALDGVVDVQRRSARTSRFGRGAGIALC
jgi:2-polyprenyl-6-methoxyphenol hydroxylase-like FAD-dependent oxidoreductase